MRQLMNIINAYGTQYFSKELPFVQDAVYM